MFERTTIDVSKQTLRRRLGIPIRAIEYYWRQRFDSLTDITIVGIESSLRCLLVVAHRHERLEITVSLRRQDTIRATRATGNAELTTAASVVATASLAIDVVLPVAGVG